MAGTLEEPAMGEAGLVVRFAAGEPGSVAEMYRAYGRLVYAVAYRVLGDAGQAEDATRDTFVQAWKLAPGFDPGRGLGPWLATIAGRTAIDHRHRRHGRHSNLAAPAPTAPEPAGPAPSAAQIQNVWLVRRALDALSDQDRELLRLQHSRQLTPAEISDRLAIPLASVTSLSRRAHIRMRLVSAGTLGRPLL